MNRVQKNSEYGLRNYFINFGFSLLSFIILFFGLSYLFFKIPNYEDYFVCFPYALLLSESLILVLFCRRFSSGSVYFTLLNSAFISLISLLVGFFYFGLFATLPKTIATHFIFVLFGTAVQLLIQRKRPVKKKKMPFHK